MPDTADTTLTPDQRKEHLARLHQLRAATLRITPAERAAVEWVLHLAEDHHHQLKELGR